MAKELLNNELAAQIRAQSKPNQMYFHDKEGNVFTWTLKPRSKKEVAQ